MNRSFLYFYTKLSYDNTSVKCMDTIMKCISNVLYYRSIKSNFRILLIMLFMLKLSYEHTT
ncbi:hypothetical protein CNEO2_740007 [Clostridium neonatale]|nr:hypothetical protein CNEO2_230007 [Clostridium neonatale]CAI3246122.1 hypothetical protein CNEO2_740007 [Clostridium neonatale]CAI3551286.1 hypothetical protein CNEO4_260008 [Clostridium neonatale]